MVAIALSLSLAGLVAEAMAMASSWSTTLGVVVLASLCSAGVAVQSLGSPRARRERTAGGVPT
ncbi:MAG: hypothetical protein ACRDYD_01425, partial [Acidimicrobiales bacterium]